MYNPIAFGPCLFFLLSNWVIIPCDNKIAQVRLEVFNIISTSYQHDFLSTSWLVLVAMIW